MSGKEHITDSDLVKLPIHEAYGEEVHLFVHIHLRGYDQNGDGKQMHAEYYDKYGAPMKLEDSWLEGYRAVEKELANHFNKCVNPKMPFPIPAASAGGAHLYDDLHHVKPWNWTGFVPDQSKWCCYDKFFSNRHFIALRGNEIQNNLWNYHPHDEQPGSSDWDDKYKQLIPTDRYRGGYFYFTNAWGRYLHVISLKSMKPEPEHCKRYNYIVHPLAYRASLSTLPDDSVDAMQWSIVNINDRKLNIVPKRQKAKSLEQTFPAFGEDQEGKWGEKCHGLEIFNDFTYYYSSTPLDDGDDWKGGNGFFHDGRIEDYIHWFDTYPLEFGEFLLETSLRHGTYIHALAANDAMYQRADIDVQFADPKASETTKYKRDFKRQTKKELHKQRQTDDEDEDEKEAREFLCEMPYQEDTVFGYTSLIDPDKSIKKNIYGSAPYNRHPDLSNGELQLFDHLIEGRFFAHTGVYNIFNYRDSNDEEIQQHCPIMIEHQDPTKFYYEYNPKVHDLKFTLPKAKKPEKRTSKNQYITVIEEDIIWQYTIEVHKKETQSVECHRGYFKLDEKRRTKLDFNESFNEDEIAWIRIQGYDTKNPMRRAWFQAIRGPMFNEMNWSEIYGKTKPQKPNPPLTNFVHNMASAIVEDDYTGEEFTTYRICQFKPIHKPESACASNLEFDFGEIGADNKDALCVYNLQVNSHAPNTDLNFASKAIPPKYLQNICGVFQLCTEYPTKLDLNGSWDKATVKDDKCYFYMVNQDAKIIPMKEILKTK